jgi:hypothetical protein
LKKIIAARARIVVMMGACVFGVEAVVVDVSV